VILIVLLVLFGENLLMRDLILASEVIEPSKLDSYKTALNVITCEGRQEDGILSYVWQTGYYDHKSIAFITDIRENKYHGFGINNIFDFKDRDRFDYWENAEPISKKELKQLRKKEKKVKVKRSGIDLFLLICVISVAVHDFSAFTLTHSLPGYLNDYDGGILMFITWIIHIVCFIIGISWWGTIKGDRCFND
jgi:hypothetical protein